MFNFIEGIKQLYTNATIRIIGRVRRPLPAPVIAPIPTNQSRDVIYLMNDPTTPNLVKTVQAPDPLQYPQFRVHGYVGGGFPLGSAQNTAASVYVTINNAINMINRHSEIKMTSWAATNNLTIIPFAGNQLNAFYNRASLQFFSGIDPATGKVVHTADSVEVVAHETGHAILDYFKPGLWSVASLEWFAFHEGFADLISILTMLQNEEIIKDIICSTNGNIRISNIVSRIAEQIGAVIYRIAPDGQRLPNCLRDAINDFQYQAPETLPKSVNNYYALAAEPHNFGRIMLGVFYDILEMIYKSELQKGIQAENALKAARDVLTAYILKAVQNMAITPRLFESFCKTLLWVDSLAGKSYGEELRKIFIARKIMPEITMLSTKKLSHIGLDDMYSMSRDIKNKSILIKNAINTIKLGNFASAFSNENHHLSDYLYDLDIETPSQSMYVIGVDGTIEEEVECDESQMIQDVFHTLKFLDENKLISDDPFTPFEVKSGKLVRTNFSSCMKKNPGDPEWGKLWKSANNAGCCSGCCDKTKKSTSSNFSSNKTIKKSCALRYLAKTNNQ